MTIQRLLLSLTTLSLLTACTGSTPTSIAMPLHSYGAGSYSDIQQAGGLASLLTGQIVSDEEQQLRDIQKRQILIDFPARVGVLFYGLGSRLDATDLEAEFDKTQAAFKASGHVRETIQIPANLLSGAVNITELRKLGARFQCDIIVLVSGTHSFEKSRGQNLSWFDSFSDKAQYQSEVKLDAIAMDVYTGTLLSPFDAAVKQGPHTLERTDFSLKSYQHQKEAEAKAWEGLRTEAVERLGLLKDDVAKRKATLAASPQPSPES